LRKLPSTAWRSNERFPPFERNVPVVRQSMSSTQAWGTMKKRMGQNILFAGGARTACKWERRRESHSLVCLLTEFEQDPLSEFLFVNWGAHLNGALDRPNMHLVGHKNGVLNHDFWPILRIFPPFSIFPLFSHLEFVPKPWLMIQGTF
jgi:hypothetical protein